MKNITLEKTNVELEKQLKKVKFYNTGRESGRAKQRQN